MNRTSLESQLAMVDRGIAEAHADADRMWKRIADLRRNGRDTRYAEETLAGFLVAHSVCEARREIILIELDQAPEPV
jgi:hypothetical protein